MDQPSTMGSSESLKDLLATFLTANPETQYRADGPHAIVDLPWGDPTLCLRVSAGAMDLINSLNAVRLPPRFSALWHRDTGDLEFVFSILPSDHPYRARVFEFVFKGKSYRCRYGDASDRLLSIARSAEPVRPPTTTTWRNITQFEIFEHQQREHPANPLSRVPTSFWVGPVEQYDDNLVSDIALHLNFFMAYFDLRTPRILFHDESAPGLVKEERFPRGQFPERIDARSLDSTLLLFWQSLFEAPDSFRRFLYAYQILEYCAFYFIEDKIVKALRRTLSAPDRAVRVEDAAREMFDVLTHSRLGDDQRLEGMIKECVSADIVWTHISQNLGAFTGRTEFDGGFVLEPMVPANTTAETFRQGWSSSAFSVAIRKLRNAIVHGRESRQPFTIAPTRANNERLKPWVAPLTCAAQEATIFCE